MGADVDNQLFEKGILKTKPDAANVWFRKVQPSADSISKSMKLGLPRGRPFFV